MAFNLNSINQNTQYNKPQVDINIEWSSVKKPSSHASSGYAGKWLAMKPIFCIPGEKHRYNPNVGIQFLPFTNNLFTELVGHIYSYFVPIRLLEDNFEEFITGGIDGQTQVTLDIIDGKHIKQQVGLSSMNDRKKFQDWSESVGGNILDSMGLGLNSALNMVEIELLKSIPDNYFSSHYTHQYVAYPIKAVNKIWNDCLRFPDYEEERDLMDFRPLPCHWNNDYITRARLYQQRGAIPLLPVTPGTLTQTLQHEFQHVSGTTDTSELSNTYANKVKIHPYGGTTRSNTIGLKLSSSTEDGANATITLNPHVVELSVDNVNINLNELMIDLGIMRYQINNARMQPRYIDQLKARFGVYPQDERLQRPEFIGAKTIKINSQGVVCTSPNGDVKQGNITSQSFGFTDEEYLEYNVVEHGIIINLFCVKPMAQYCGFTPKQWFHKTRFDYPTPELANTPDVQIERAELFYSILSNGEESNKVGLGWTDIYSEYRTEMNTVGGLLNPLNSTEDHPSLDSYTLCRFWSPENPPEMNASLIQVPFPCLNRVKQYIDQPDFIYFYRCDDNVAQPLPIRSEPVAVANLG